MNISEQLSHQRVKHIVNSYQLHLEPSDLIDDFEDYLADLLRVYPAALIELALVETLVDNWLTVPLVRGFQFLLQAHQKLKTWEQQPIVSTITPEQFQQIAGLDPSPIFGPTRPTRMQPTVHPS
ncbi:MULTISPECIES: hypothetical protein [Trichocoleus]|uniref:Uncharacterized protein n=1 Tax=Trichocoleus desertorum GB2-A4 TaxID=2933944 RepID=A0ABV0J333_9CYAN|nr:hypothetical protein [Trichocoleus sp. FACHB-46]MBD1860795.1 hypothetical protein [Trichocoleus sp. FACHB-46]